jgi:hypothetical protein
MFGVLKREKSFLNLQKKLMHSKMLQFVTADTANCNPFRLAAAAAIKFLLQLSIICVGLKSESVYSTASY